MAPDSALLGIVPAIPTPGRGWLQSVLGACEDLAARLGSCLHTDGTGYSQPCTSGASAESGAWGTAATPLALLPQRPLGSLAEPKFQRLCLWAELQHMADRHIRRFVGPIQTLTA